MNFYSFSRKPEVYTETVVPSTVLPSKDIPDYHFETTYNQMIDENL